jgi:hypothetical protein
MTLLILALSLFMPIRTFAQKAYAVDKGSMLVGGSAGFTSIGGDAIDEDGDRVSVFVINPDLLFFVSPHVALGGAVSVVSVSFGGESNTTFGIGPTVGYYFGNENSKTYPFIKGRFIYTNDADDFSETDFQFEGGAAFMIAKNVALTGSAFYLIQSFKPEGADESISGNTFGIQFGIEAFVF